VINSATRTRRARGPALLAVLSLVLSCRSAPAQARIDAVAARAYAEGRGREIEFTDAALAMLACATTEDQRSVIAAGASPDHAEIAAAGGVGMRVADYRALVVRVDSVLRGSRELDVRTQHLDSLRVQLTVLRTRMNAGQSPQLASTQNPQSRSRPCYERR
jgi:hypothetical protein